MQRGLVLTRRGGGGGGWALTRRTEGGGLALKARQGWKKTFFAICVYTQNTHNVAENSKRVKNTKNEGVLGLAPASSSGSVGAAHTTWCIHKAVDVVPFFGDP